MLIDIQEVIRASKAGGDVIKNYFGEVLEVEEKSHVSDFIQRQTNYWSPAYDYCLLASGRM